MTNRIAQLAAPRIHFAATVAPAPQPSMAGMVMIPVAAAVADLHQAIFAAAYAQAQRDLARPRHERLLVASWN